MSYVAFMWCRDDCIWPVQPVVGVIQRCRQAAAMPCVVPQSDHGSDVGLQQLAGEAAVVAQQGVVGMSHVTCRHHSRPVEGEVEVVHPNLPDFIHLQSVRRITCHNLNFYTYKLIRNCTFLKGNLDAEPKPYTSMLQRALLQICPVKSTNTNPHQ